MGSLLIVLAVIAVAVAVTSVIGHSWGKHPWSGSGGGGPFGPIDEVFAPTRHEAMAELKHQYDRTAPAPIPGAPPWLDVDLEDGRSGSVTIHPRRPGTSDPTSSSKT